MEMLEKAGGGDAAELINRLSHSGERGCALPDQNPAISKKWKKAI
jgi:hypothetical protein